LETVIKDVIQQSNYYVVVNAYMGLYRQLPTCPKYNARTGPLTYHIHAWMVSFDDTTWLPLFQVKDRWIPMPDNQAAQEPPIGGPDAAVFVVTPPFEGEVVPLPESASA
jgi:hypothetical protein